MNSEITAVLAYALHFQSSFVQVPDKYEVISPKSKFVLFRKFLIFYSSFGFEVRKKEGIFSSPYGAKDYSKNDHFLPVMLHVCLEIFDCLKWEYLIMILDQL